MVQPVPRLGLAKNNIYATNQLDGISITVYTGQVFILKGANISMSDKPTSHSNGSTNEKGKT